MRNCLLLLRLWIAACLVTAIAGVPPAQAQPQRTVSDWLALANQQLAHGKAGMALMIYGEIAAQHPRYTPAQEGLRRSFAKIGSVGRSEAFLRYALAEDPARAPALLAAWQALDRAHPLRFSASASMLPSNNIDHVSSKKYLVTDIGTFLIDGGGQETSGVGLGFRLNLDWFLHPRPGSRVRLRASYAGAWFDSATLRYGEPSLAVRYEHLGGRAPWSLEAFASNRRYGGAPEDITDDNIARGLDFRTAWRPARGGRVLLQLGGDYRRYPKKPYLTGPHYDLGLERRRRLGGKGHLSYGLFLERGLPRTDYHRYTGAALQISYGRPLFPGLRAAVSLGVGQRNYDATFPIVGVRRRDQTVSLGVSARMPKLRILGRIPAVSCTARRTRSNIALYTTNSVDCAFTLNLDF